MKRRYSVFLQTLFSDREICTTVSLDLLNAVHIYTHTQEASSLILRQLDAACVRVIRDLQLFLTVCFTTK